MTTQHFSRQLNTLFSRTHPTPTNLTVITALRDYGCSISTPYFSQLRTGVRTNPSPTVVNALARYFGVAPHYFYDAASAPDYFRPPRASDTASPPPANNTVSADQPIITQLHNRALRELLSQCLALSPHSIELLTTLTTKLHHADQYTAAAS